MLLIDRANRHLRRVVRFQGRTTVYPLAAIFTLAATAMLCGCHSPAAIAQWGRDYNHLTVTLGFSRTAKDKASYRTPCTSELHTALAALPATAFDAALRRWFLAQGVMDLERRVVAIDGKSLRGSRGHQLPGVHPLAAYGRDVEAVIAQLRVPCQTNEHKTAVELLQLIPLEGTLVTGDAAFTRRDLCAAVVKVQGDYFLTVKGNQPTPEVDVRAAFGPASSPSGGGTTVCGRRPGRGPRQGARSG